MFSAKNLAIVSGIALTLIILFNTNTDLSGKPYDVKNCDDSA